MSGHTDTAQVAAAADALIGAFSRHDTTAYFEAFAADATFVFYTHPVRLESRDAYETLWRTWEADGFRVLSCQSDEQLIQIVNEVAIFTHRVATSVLLNDERTDLVERETIVFARRDGRWVAIHEHLSPVAE